MRSRAPLAPASPLSVGSMPACAGSGSPMPVRQTMSLRASKRRRWVMALPFSCCWCGGEASTSNCVVSTVDEQVRAGHEARGVGGEENRRGGDLLRLPEAVQQMLGPEHLARLLHGAEAQHAFGLHRARRQRI